MREEVPDEVLEEPGHRLFIAGEVAEAVATMSLVDEELPHHQLADMEEEPVRLDIPVALDPPEARLIQADRRHFSHALGEIMQRALVIEMESVGSGEAEQGRLDDLVVEDIVAQLIEAAGRTVAVQEEEPSCATLAPSGCCRQAVNTAAAETASCRVDVREQHEATVAHPLRRGGVMEPAGVHNRLGGGTRCCRVSPQCFGAEVTQPGRGSHQRLAVSACRAGLIRPSRWDGPRRPREDDRPMPRHRPRNKASGLFNHRGHIEARRPP